MFVKIIGKVWGIDMRILVDADACPVVRQVESAARRYKLSVVLLCDTNHILSSNYSEVCTIGAGRDAVDFALINRCCPGDIVVTQDYGVAAMALGRSCRAIHPSGMWYTQENMDRLLMERHMAGEARRASGRNHIRGPKKRKTADNERFIQSLERLILDCIGNDGGMCNGR